MNQIKAEHSSEAGVTIVQVCMFISILLSVAGAAFWASMAMKQTTVEERITEIKKEADLYHNQNKQLQEYEKNLKPLISSEREGLEQTQIKDVKTLRTNVINNYEYLNENMTLRQIVKILDQRVEDTLQEYRALVHEKREIENRLTHQQQRLDRYRNTLPNYRSMLTGHREELSTKDEQVKDEIKEIQDQQQKTEEELTQVIEKEKKQHKKKVEELERKLRGIKTEIAQLKQQRIDIKIQREPVGKILSTTTDNKWAYINLGSEDRIHPGLQFKVVEEEVEGSFTTKGWIEVKEVSSDTSRCHITSGGEGSDPILKGHQLMNPLYNPKRPLVFALAGNFVGRNQLINNLKEAGATVKETPTVDVDFLIVGRNYQDNKNFKKADEIGIPTMDVNEVKPFLGDS